MSVKAIFKINYLTAFYAIGFSYVDKLQRKLLPTLVEKSLVLYCPQSCRSLRNKKKPQIKLFKQQPVQKLKPLPSGNSEESTTVHTLEI